MHLFNTGVFKLHSGQTSNFKIDCDALSDEDIDHLAELISYRFKFSGVVGVPEGGLRLQRALYKYTTKVNTMLIVDDVFTTGASMELTKSGIPSGRLIGVKVQGVVVFARGKCPRWITPMFRMWAC